jgi:phosphonate transport system substrate-binding protein
MKSPRALLGSSLLVASLALGCSAGNEVSAPGSSGTPGQASVRRDPEVLKIALLPDESPASIIKKNEKLRTYLESALKRKVDLVVTTDYSSMIEAMRRGQIDVGYFGPLSYVLLKQKMPGAMAFAAKLEGTSPTYRAVVIAGTDSGVKTLQDVKGKSVAFGDPASTSSHLIPKHMLLEAGLKAGQDYQEHFAGAHDAAALAVQGGNAQAGGLSRYLFDSLVEQGTIKTDRVRVIAESKPYPNYPWVLADDLVPQLQEAIRSAFYNLKDKDVLKPIKADGFAPMRDEDYNEIRDMAKILGVNAEKPR